KSTQGLSPSPEGRRGSGHSLKRDGIFRGSSKAELTAQVLTMTGDPGAGYRASAVVGLVA
ncbi:MAG: hypothetical protein V4583_19440, partial [Pseudomonadota bacterium]